MLTIRTHAGSPPEQEPRNAPGARADDATEVVAEVVAEVTAPHGKQFVRHTRHLYLGNHRTAVDVEVDGQWYDGELRSWDQAADRTWSGAVAWRRVGGELLLDRFPAHRIRQATGDGSSG